MGRNLSDHSQSPPRPSRREHRSSHRDTSPKREKRSSRPKSPRREMSPSPSPPPPARQRSSRRDGSPPPPSREKGSSHAKSPKREQSRSPSPRTKRLRRAQAEREAEKEDKGRHREREVEKEDKGRHREREVEREDKGRHREREVEREDKGRHKEREAGKERDRERERRSEGKGTRRERESEKEHNGRAGDKDTHSHRGRDADRETRDERKERRSGRDEMDGKSTRARHEQSSSPSDRHRSKRRSPSPQPAADSRERNEATNSRGAEQRNSDDDDDSLAKMKAAEDALEANQKQKPSFELSGKLAAETNRYRGITLLFNEPPDARKPDMRWRLYVFKGGDVLNEPLYIHRQSCYLFGRERRVADIPTDHPSCSKQHAVIQFRQVEKELDDGTTLKQVKPYIMDLGSTNKTYVNDNPIEPQRYYELLEKDTIKFGNTSRNDGESSNFIFAAFSGSLFVYALGASFVECSPTKSNSHVSAFAAESMYCCTRTPFRDESTVFAIHGKWERRKQCLVLSTTGLSFVGVSLPISVCASSRIEDMLVVLNQPVLGPSSQWRDGAGEEDEDGEDDDDEEHYQFLNVVELLLPQSVLGIFFWVLDLQVPLVKLLSF
ncbi:hypothetical protein Tsubulata_026034 [Turnera subulata]|uniref:FHA domain-containing protein n=1 Tax=Turnera subulata TaxID=218843 RepID=A0A9Q0FY94_9ROSI|nr:hypothetical protein Tsubulata_026034 [Turnera subulata]